jgi:hypothetical protein
MILLFYYWLHVKRVNCYVYYDLFCYTGRFVYFGARQQPEVYLQRVNKEWFRTSVTDCDLSWLTRKYFDSRLYLLFHGLKVIKCMLSIWSLNLFIKRHVSLKVNIYYSHMHKLILEPCAWICKHPWPWSWWLKIFISKW